MPPKKSFLRDNVALVSSMIPVVAVIIAGFGYVFTMANNVSESKEKSEKIEAQLEQAGRILEVNSFGESTLELEISGLSYYVHEEIEGQLVDISERLTLLEIAIADLQAFEMGTLFYLYTETAEQNGVAKSIQSIKLTLSLLEQSVDNVHADHQYFISVLEEIEDEFDIRLSKPPDVYGGGYGTYR